jgi:asparagine synthase (glutamine-hydrolysing)
MSGFCGAVDFTGAPIPAEVLLQMAAVSQGLGPDGMTARSLRKAAFCHLALHASPASCAEKQPLLSPDGTLCLVADLRLDNRTELLGELSEQPLGDDSLVLAAYLRWGTSCPEKLLGDFAFVIWDEQRQRLFCARDPLGMKSLHYARVGALFCFASEAQQILQHPRVPGALDEQTIADYLIDAWDDPKRTFYRAVRRLPPAHRMIVTEHGEHTERFWDIDPERRISYSDPRSYAEHFLEIFGRAVSDRLPVLDGPVAVALSGGMDSSAVAAMARRVVPSDQPLGIFACSFVFNNLQECDERSYIFCTAAHLGIDVALIDTEQFWYLGDSNAERPQIESPARGPEPSFHEMLARIRSRGARVLLTGNGGDELMAGSPLVYLDRLLQGDLRVLVETTRHAIKHRFAGGRILYRYFGQPLFPAADRKLRKMLGRFPMEIPEWLLPEFVARTRLTDRVPSAYFPAHHRRGAAWQELYDQMMHLHSWERAISWYTSHASPFGVEVRYPFLDRRLVEFMLAIPPRQRSQPGCYKPLLRQSMAGLLPEIVRQRADKTTHRAFIDFAVRHRRRAKIEKLLQNPVAAEMGIIDCDKLYSAYQSFLRDDSKRSQYLWNTFSLEVWLREITSARCFVHPRVSLASCATN